MPTITDSMSASQCYGYVSQKPVIRNRLKRVEGQVRRLSKMIDEDKYCIDIMTQVAAVKSALDKVALELSMDHAKHCLSNDPIHATRADNKADQLVGDIERML